MRSIRQYRPYQVDIHKFVTKKHGGNFGVEGPTGSGKTMQIVGLVAHGKRHKRWKKILIATTQQQIEEAIVHREYDAIAYGGEVLPAPDDMIAQARGGQSGTGKAVRDFLRGGSGFAMACTHLTCARFKIEDFPSDLTGHLLIGDEGHHFPAEGLSRFERAWTERGGTISLFTATGYRSDGKKVGADDMVWFIRSMAQHMEEGYAPKNLHYGVVAIKKKARVSYEQLTGSKAPPRPFIADIVRSMVVEWVRLDRGKTMVRVPPMAGGTKTLVGAIINGFEKEKIEGRPLRVIDATGIENKKAFLKFIKEESRRRWGDSEADVVVGSQRVMEGTDWPHCENMFCVGIPGSVTTVVQLTGRTMRMKDKTCPKKRSGQANVIFFVPTGSNNTLKKMSVDHSRAILMISCFMADSKSGQQWLLDKELRRFKRKMEPEDQSDRSSVLVQMADIRRKAEKEGRRVTLKELISGSKKKLPDVDAGLIEKIAVEALMKSKEGKKVKDLIDREYGMGPTMSKAAQKVLDTIVKEFRDVTLDGEDSMEMLGRQTHLLDGGSISEWADKVIVSLPNLLPLSYEQILKWADEHHAKTGTWPSAHRTRDPIPGTSESWPAIDGSLSVGRRGLPGEESLAGLLHKERGRYSASRKTPGRDQILKWADEWFRKNEVWPKTMSGDIPGVRAKWHTINANLKAGKIGPKSSLRALLKQHRGVRDHFDMDDLSEAKVLSWVDAWFRKNGRWPSSADRNKSIPGTQDTWGTIEGAMRAGRRGLKKGSLWLLISPDFDHGTILALADKWFRENGRWPTMGDGSIPGTRETWSSMSGSMRTGKRGLPKCSLAKLLYEKRGVYSKSVSSRLSKTKIIGWAKDWFKANGRWPNSDTKGVIPGTHDTWARVNSALHFGNRGLPPGSSLLKLLKPLTK